MRECARCHNLRDLPEGLATCGPCLRGMRRYKRRRAQALYLSELCRDCKRPSHYVYCPACRERHRLRMARRREARP
jgi:hypothetical protein